MAELQPVLNKKVVIPDWLKDYESTFLWHSMAERGLGLDFVILRIQEKLDDLNVDEPDFCIQRFVSLLKLVLEYYIIGDINKSWEIMAQIESLVEKEEIGDDPLYENVKLSLAHVISSSKACLFALDNQEDEAQKLLTSVIPISLMADHEVAAVNAMKARFFLYSGYEKGEDLGVQYAKMANKLEPENPEWEYLLAKMLRQKRRDVPLSGDIPKEEIPLLESAVKKKKCSKYLVYLAQVYREASLQTYRHYKNTEGVNFFKSDLFKVTESMGEKAFSIYKEALEMEPTSPAVLRRVGYGIMNLDRKIADYDLAEKCLLASLEMSQNQMTLHVLGTFYNRYKKDDKKALYYFEKTAILGSHAGISDMIRVKFSLDPTYDPCPELDKGIQWPMKKKHIHQLLTQKGGYFLFIKKDYLKCIESFRQVISESKDSPHLKSFKSIFLRMKEPINLYKYLFNEGLILVNKVTSQGKSSSNEDYVKISENVGLIEEFIDMIGKIQPALLDITPDPSLIDNLVLTSKQIIKKDKMNNTMNFQNSNRNYRSNKPGGYRGNKAYQQGGGRGKNTQGRENFCMRRVAEGFDGPSSDNSYERRGRFSVANQRNTFYDDETSMRNRSHGSNQSSTNEPENSQENWRQPKNQRGKYKENFNRNQRSDENHRRGK